MTGSVCGEASPAYTYYPFYKGVPERMHEIIPRAKLIYALRDPIDRVVASYVHNVARGRECRPIAEALADLEANRYVCPSKYSMQLERYLPYYDWSQILILTTEELSRHRRHVLQRVFRFLDIEDSFATLRFYRIKHPSSMKRRLTAWGRRLARTRLMRGVDRWPFDVREKVKAIVYFPFSRPVKRPQLDEPLRQKLIDYLSDDVDRLRSATGLDFSDWCL